MNSIEELSIRPLSERHAGRDMTVDDIEEYADELRQLVPNAISWPLDEALRNFRRAESELDCLARAADVRFAYVAAREAVGCLKALL